MQIFKTSPSKHEISSRSFATVQLILKAPEEEHFHSEIKIKIGKCKLNLFKKIYIQIILVGIYLQPIFYQLILFMIA